MVRVLAKQLAGRVERSQLADRVDALMQIALADFAADLGRFDTERSPRADDARDSDATACAYHSRRSSKFFHEVKKCGGSY